MAEVLGVVASVASSTIVAGLTKLSMEAFDIIQIAQNQGQEYEKLSLRLNIERARFCTWNQAMGLTSHTKEDRTDRIHGSHFESLVTNTLNLIFQLFQNGEAQNREDRCTVYEEKVDIQRPAKDGSEPKVGRIAIEKLKESFVNFAVLDKRQAEQSGLLCKTQ